MTARCAMFRGHLPAPLPFLATRPALTGAGVLLPDGRYELTARGQTLRVDVAAFIYGPRRPLVDLKELDLRKPLRWLRARKRLHLLAGDANRAETSQLLKLGVTELALDAIEAGALDALAARLELRGGAAGALRATAADPNLRAVVARDRLTLTPLTALEVQRLYLDAVGEWAAGREFPARARDALDRLRFTVERRARPAVARPRARLGDQAAPALSPRSRTPCPTGRSTAPGRSWPRWPPADALLERRAPDLALPMGEPAEATRARVERAVGRFAARRAARGLDWAALPAVRAAWLRLKALDLRYHDGSRRGLLTCSWPPARSRA